MIGITIAIGTGRGAGLGFGDWDLDRCVIWIRDCVRYCNCDWDREGAGLGFGTEIDIAVGTGIGRGIGDVLGMRIGIGTCIESSILDRERVRECDWDLDRGCD